ncbi:MAG: histidine phosphatase family protein [Armatimonadetes bacterium]|nr:histidine phosphatase family protein [Armatimonadota bacterium]
MMRLYLVRHGQTAWNADGRAQGHSDVDLDDNGLAQAEILKDALVSSGARRILSSDLKRCVATAKPLATALNLEITQREALRERTFGVLEGKHYTDLRFWFQAESRAQGLSEFELRPDNGESVKDVWKRLTPIDREINRGSDHAVVIAHGGTCALLLARLVNATVESSRSFRFENASITELVRRPDGFWQLLRYNDTRHLGAK